MRTQNCFDSNLAYMDHSLPPLGLFFANPHQLPISKSNTLVETWREIFQEKLIKDSKTPPFFHNQAFSPQEISVLTIRDKQEYFDNQKL
jgi:hypothetical protein